MRQAAADLRGAAEIRTPQRDLFFQLVHLRAAHRTLPGKFVGLALQGSALEVHLDHRRNDLAGLLHEHVVADTDVLAGDLVLVVQCGTRHGGPGQDDRLQFGHGRQHTCATNLDRNGVDLGLGPLGLELVGDGPARRLGRAARLAPQSEVVHFGHCTVRAVGEGVPQSVELADRLPRFVYALRRPEFLHRGQAPSFDQGEKLALCVGDRRLTVADAVEHDLQFAPGDLLGIELLDRAGGKVARIRIDRFTRLLALLVDALELRGRQVNLPADLDHVRCGMLLGRFQLGRQRVNRAGIDRDVVALLAVAARDGPYEFALLVGHAHRESVHLGLDHVGQLVAAE